MNAQHPLNMASVSKRWQKKCNKILPEQLVRLLSCYPEVNKSLARASSVRSEHSESETNCVGLKHKRV
jgi:hypothetical protein